MPINPIDMSMTELEDSGQKNRIIFIVRNHIFPIWKFYDKQYDGPYDTDEKTMCGLLMKNMFHCPMGERWWISIRPIVTQTITNTRNNVIKEMHRKYKGKLDSCDQIRY
jgi:L-rhamnose mutarotase